MNRDSFISLVRGIFYMCGGGGLIGGWLTESLLTEVLGAVFTLGAAGWSIWAWRTARLVVITNAREPVAGVIMKPTAEGVALANATPSKTVAVAGSDDAAVVAERLIKRTPPPA